MADSRLRDDAGFLTVSPNASGPIQVRVLLADADFYLAETYRRHLVRRGFQVLTADEGQECVKLIRDFRPQVLVLGTSLPREICLAVLEVIHQDASLRPAAIIVLASQAERGVLYHVAANQIDDYEMKPLPPARLVQRIEEILGERNAALSTPASGARGCGRPV